MKIVVLKSSFHKTGASNTLAQHFINGASEAGHTVVTFDLPRMNIRCCKGCYCGVDIQHCIMKDDFYEIENALTDAGMIVYVTPVYYYLMAAPLKTVIDRLHCFEPKLHGLKSLFITTAHRSDNQVMQHLNDFYLSLVDYLEFDNQGAILAKGCYDIASVNDSHYSHLAYKIGRSL